MFVKRIALYTQAIPLVTFDLSPIQSGQAVLKLTNMSNFILKFSASFHTFIIKSLKPSLMCNYYYFYYYYTA